MHTDSHLAELDRIQTQRVLRAAFQASHPEYLATQSLDARDNVAPPPSASDCAAMDETIDGVAA